MANEKSATPAKEKVVKEKKAEHPEIVVIKATIASITKQLKDARIKKKELVAKYGGQ